MITKEQQTYWNKPVKEKVRKYYTIPKISKKKKERLKKYWNERDLFIEIAKERSENGYVFLEDINWIMKKCHITNLQPINFAHIKSKKQFPELRYDKENIKLVTFANHFFEHNNLHYKGPYLPN